jgi:hypothetical protein
VDEALELLSGLYDDARADGSCEAQLAAGGVPRVDFGDLRGAQRRRSGCDGEPDTQRGRRRQPCLSIARHLFDPVRQQRHREARLVVPPGDEFGERARRHEERAPHCAHGDRSPPDR